MGSDDNVRETGPDEGAAGPDEAASRSDETSASVTNRPAAVSAGEAAESDDGAQRDASARTPERDHAGRKHAKKGLKEALERAEARAAELSAANEALQAEAKDLKDKWLRSAAEYENYRKRTRREWELLEQRTKAEIILDVLAVVDDFERAFSVAGERDDDFIRGIRLIYNNLMSILEKIGVRKIEALDAAFDPAYHMAVAQIEKDGADSNHVVEIVQEGYCLGDFLVRPAKVIIAK